MSEETAERAKSHQERPLQLFRTPIDCEREQELIKTASGSRSGSDESEDLSHVAIPRAETATHFSSKQPPLHRHHEARPIELFYDLFFVANLATYTAQNSITNIEGLTNYIGFFTVMWFTWAQVSFYVVRFSRDSVFDRICWAGQFGVMTGYSFIAYFFDPAGQDPVFADTGTGYVDGQALCFLLMASRLILTLQYLVTLFSLRHYAPSRTPLILSASTCFLAAMLFLGLSFSFGPQGAKAGNSLAYLGWYIESFVETLLVIIVSCIWRSVSFKGTHLCERLNLLTLIVLGEGILGMSRGIVYVWGNTEYYVGLGVTVSSTILLLYGFYQLYFDTTPQDHFGSIRQQIWSFMHFPLHLALILFDEGTKQFIKWNAAVKQATSYNHFYSAVPLAQTVTRAWYAHQETFEYSREMNTTEYFQSQADLFWQSYYDFINPNVTNTGTGVKDYINTDELTEFADIISNGTQLTTLELAAAVGGWYVVIFNAVAQNFGIESSYKPTVSENSTTPGITELEQSALEFNGVFQLFDMVFRYFYIGTGFSVLFMLLLWGLSKLSKNTVFDYVRFVYWFGTGTTICFLSFIDHGINNVADKIHTFINGCWVIAVPMILIMVLLIVFHLPFGENRKKPLQPVSV